MNPNEMTLENCLRWLTTDMGWSLVPMPGVVNTGADAFMWEHPGRPGTGKEEWMGLPIGNDLDAIASFLPDGWEWERSHHGQEWLAWSRGVAVSIEDTGDEKLDRARLAVARRMAERGSK